MTLTLEQKQLILLSGHCSGAGGCAGKELIFALSFVLNAAALPASAIVSGSIAVIGNTIFWLQERGQCHSVV